MLKNNRKVQLMLLGLLFISLLLIVFLLINRTEEDKTINDITENNNSDETVIGLEEWQKVHEGLFVVSGKFVCLPLKDKTKPHNDLCVFGLQSGDNYYRLQKISDDDLNVLNKIREGQNIEISGDLIEEENDEYISLGVIKVTGIRYLETDANELKSNIPASFQANYISFQDFNSGIFKAEDYPSRIDSRVLNGEIDCDETKAESSLSLRINKKEINGRKYCVGASSEGAAGSVYTQYAYTTVIDNYVYLVQFVAQYPNCPNYPDKERAECEAERESFNLDILVDQEIEKMRN